MNIIVHKYRIYPKGNASELIGILQTAHHYYNKHIEIERECRELYRAERRKLYPEYETLDKESEAIREAMEPLRKIIKAVRKQIRGRANTSFLEEKAELNRLTEKSREISIKLKALRIEVNGGARYVAAKELVETLTAEKKASGKRWNKQDELDEAKKKVAAVVAVSPLGQEQERLNNIRRDKKAEVGKMGLWSGQYALCEEAVQQACRTAKGDPDFSRQFTGGRLGVGSKGGWEAPVARVLEGTDLMMRISPSDHLAGKKWQKLMFRIGTNHSENGIVPIWSEFDLVLHRPMPVDTILLRAYVKGRVNSLGQWCWDLCVTLRTETTRGFASSGDCVINVGWTKKEDGSIRVGEILTSKKISTESIEQLVSQGWLRASKHGYEVLAPVKYVELLEHSRVLKGFSDKHFNNAMGKRDSEDMPHTAFMALCRLPDAPMWLQVDAESAHLWKSPNRLIPIVERLREKYLAGRCSALTDEWRHECLVKHAPHKFDLYPSHEGCKQWAKGRGLTDIEATVFALEQWRLKHRHLTQWACGEREKVANARRDAFRKIARALSNSYAHCVLSDIDLAELAKLEDTESDKANELHKPQRSNRVMAAASEFRDAVKLAFGDRCDKPEKAAKAA